MSFLADYILDSKRLLPKDEEKLKEILFYLKAKTQTGRIYGYVKVLPALWKSSVGCLGLALDSLAYDKYSIKKPAIIYCPYTEEIVIISTYEPHSIGGVIYVYWGSDEFNEACALGLEVEDLCQFLMSTQYKVDLYLHSSFYPPKLD